MPDPMEFARRAVQEAQARGAEYVEARANRLEREQLGMRNARLARAAASSDAGLGVRVLKNGAWGFAAAPDWSMTRARDLARRAVGMAEALAGVRRAPVELAPEQGYVAEYRTPYEIDPFRVPLAEKLELLRAAEASQEGVAETVVREAGLSFRREEQWQASSEGAAIFQELLRTGAGISTTVAAHGRVQTRSWPASFGGDYRAAGWEHVQALGLAQHGARMRDEALALCSADACPGGVRDLILTGNQLMLQIHESVGHPDELDRVLGHEVDLAGASFATPDKLGKLRYGSEIVNLVADSTIVGGLDTRGFDDDGVASQRFHVVRDGIFVGYHTNRESSRCIGEEQSRATNRAEGWYNPPIIRITNLSLQPGSWKLEQLIADTEDGVLCDTVKMWSIDQQRVNFQFTTEIGWEIKDGKRTRLLRDPTYQGRTIDFWRSCDAICDQSEWQLWGVPNCGKGNPMQLAEMSHGAAPARFRGVTFVASGTESGSPPHS